MSILCVWAMWKNCCRPSFLSLLIKMYEAFQAVIWAVIKSFIWSITLYFYSHKNPLSIGHTKTLLVLGHSKEGEEEKSSIDSRSITVTIAFTLHGDNKSIPHCEFVLNFIVKIFKWLSLNVLPLNSIESLNENGRFNKSNCMTKDFCSLTLYLLLIPYWTVKWPMYHVIVSYLSICTFILYFVFMFYLPKRHYITLSF